MAAPDVDRPVIPPAFGGAIPAEAVFIRTEYGRLVPLNRAHPDTLFWNQMTAARRRIGRQLLEMPAVCILPPAQLTPADEL